MAVESDCVDGEEPDVEMIRVYQLHEVFSTGKTPEATYTPRAGSDPDGVTFDEKFKEKARRRSGGVMLFGVSKSGKTSLVERVLPEGEACWLQGTRLTNVNDFWNTLAHQLNLADRVTNEASQEVKKTDTSKGEIGIRAFAMGSLESTDAEGTGSRQTWTYSNVVSQQVEDHLSNNAVPIVIDDFHHMEAGLREAIAKLIKPLLRKTFVTLIAIPSHSFDPAKAASDIGGRMVKFQIPQWTERELVAIAGSGFSRLRIVDTNSAVSGELARNSFGSPHVMQELCFTLLDKNGVSETAKDLIELTMPANLSAVVRNAATEAEPMAFGDLLTGRSTKGEARKPIALNSGGATDSYGITLMAIKELIPPMNLRFKAIRDKVSELASENVTKQRIVTALSGMSAMADKKKGNADPIFSYRDEIAYIEDPMLAFFLKYGDWQPHDVGTTDADELRTLF